MNLKETLSQLADLYDATGVDWDLEVYQSLTEPTCPTVFIQPEGWNISRYRVDCDTIEEGIEKCVALVKAEVIDRQVLGSYSPISNPNDDAYAKWLHARAKGDDGHLRTIKPK